MKSRHRGRYWFSESVSHTCVQPPLGINSVTCFLRATQVTFHYLWTTNAKLSMNIGVARSPSFQINNLSEQKTTQVYIYIYIYMYIIFPIRKARYFNIISINIIINTPSTLVLGWSGFFLKLTQISKSVLLSVQEVSLGMMGFHYDDVTMSGMASQITSLRIVYSTVYPGPDQRKHQSPASLAFVREIHRGPVNFPHKWPVTRKMFPFDDVIMKYSSMPHCYKTTIGLPRHETR